MSDGLFREDLFVKQMAAAVGAGSEGEGEGCPFAVPLTPLGWTPSWPLYLPISFSRKHSSKQELYFKGRNKEMKDVGFE